MYYFFVFVGDAFVGGFLSQLVKDKPIEYLLNEVKSIR
jgi:fructose-1-phosphate kinase PfkB-like protein